jgi:DNA-binding transcriptional LysR family regulator
VVAACRAAGVAPTLVEMPDGHVERALMAVASGTGMAVFPECISERYRAAGISFVRLNGSGPILATAVVSRRDTEHMPTVAFLRAMSQERERPSPINDDKRAVAA